MKRLLVVLMLMLSGFISSQVTVTSSNTTHTTCGVVFQAPGGGTQSGHNYSQTDDGFRVTFLPIGTWRNIKNQFRAFYNAW